MAAFVDYNPTMATASMTMASHSVDHNPSVMSSIDHHIESREESIEKLRSNLIRYAHSNDRRMILRSLKDVSFLSYIPLEAPVRSDISIVELEKEANKGKVVLNETLLNPRSEQRNLSNAATNSGCTPMLKAYAKVLCENSNLNESTLLERVLPRLARSSISNEIYYQLNVLMGSAELNVKKVPSDSTIKPSSSNQIENKKNNAGDLSDIKLYNSGGQIHMILTSTFTFGLFRKNDASTNRPWALLKCTVHERANFSTNESCRSLSVKTPNLY